MATSPTQPISLGGKISNKDIAYAPHVGHLLDLGRALSIIDIEAREQGAEWFGKGYHDFVPGVVEGFDYGSAAASVMAQDPEAWSSIARASLLVVQGSENDVVLAQNLEHLAVIVVAWIRDVKNRNPVE